MRSGLLGCLIGGSLLFAAGGVVAGQIGDVYGKHCAECHGPDRLGGQGPALLPQNLSRVSEDEARKVIADGRTATQMPAYADKLDSEQIQALVDYIYTPLPEVPDWGPEQIRGSRVVHHRPGSLPDRPTFDADPMNLFTVVEKGDHHVTILDGDRFEPLVRFKSRFALHGGAKYSPDGRFVYLASRDGWVTKYDLYNFKKVVEVRAGINTRNIAVSADGQWVAVANYLPHTLTILDARTLEPKRVIPVEGREGKSSRVSAVYTAPPRGSFVAALKDVTEIWEIAYAEPALGRIAGDGGRFPLRRLGLDTYLDDFFFNQAYTRVIGAARDKGQARVIELDSGERLGTLELGGMPHLGSGITWDYQGRTVMATPHLHGGKVSVIDMERFETLREIDTMGPGFFMRSHPGTRYAWVDVFFGPNKDRVHVIDKRTLEIEKTLRPAPGKTAAHVEFTRDGDYALLSIWDRDGALVVYDAHTLEEVKRIPMSKPSGKYNVYNKTHYARGTSH